MGLTTEILNFFRIDKSIVNQERNNLEPFSISDFLKATNKEFSGKLMKRISIICKKLESEGLIINAGKKGNSLFLSNCYYCIDFDQKVAEYGSYDFLVEGFLSIRNTFKESVLPIVVEHSETNIIDIGTGFIIGNNLIVTAKHCLKNMNYINIKFNNQTLNIKQVIIHSNLKQDIALIETSENYFLKNRKLIFEKGDVLDEILTLGYPPISGFDAVQFSETGTINTRFKTSTGNIVGEDISYLDELEYFLINARVKGGSSGSPVINKYGRVVGMLLQLPFDSQNQESIDIMGYAIAIPSENITFLIKDGNNIKIKVENIDKGFKITVP